MLFVFVVHFLPLDLVFEGLDELLHLVLFIVELVLQCQKVLVQRDPVSQQRFIAGSLVLLVHFSIFEELNFVLHKDYLLLHV